ncbi:30S ribosomal protein S31, chloroplastic [Mercurialis annua]|uniref:30S ribosomal protein S31, chloroplastic n=1 Tax=Mercurialis annua TaxID=3986 RepID=UPI00215FAE71|nr:30S ribosomal protein S31, chloroplastic [Mercurialis annua]
MASLMMATALPFTPHSSHRFSSSLGISLSLSTPSLTLSTASPLPFVYCGRGDRKTAKGKRFNHSFGNARPRNKTKGRGPPRIPAPSAPIKKDSFEDDEVVKIDIDESLA